MLFDIRFPIIQYPVIEHPPTSREVQLGHIKDLSALAEQRRKLDHQIAAGALAAEAEGVSMREIAAALDVAPSTAHELVKRTKAVPDDVVVVAARWAYQLCLDCNDALGFGVYSCQEYRGFRSADWMGWYLDKAIRPEFGRILHVEGEVSYTDSFIEALAARGGQYDEQTAAAVRWLRDSGARPEHGTNEIVLLSGRDDKARSLILEQPIVHHGRGAWTRRQRYVSSEVLRQQPATTHDLARLMATI